jgi:hypothetical protein
MSTQLDSDLGSSYEHLPPERRAQVLEYARWLRENEAELPDRLRSRCPRAETPQPGPGQMDPELERAVQGLDCIKQVLIEEYVLSLAEGRGTPGYVFLQFAGTIPEESLRRMEQVIEEECERIDYDGW